MRSFIYIHVYCDVRFDDIPSILSKLKLANVNTLVIGYLNINSLAGKFDELKVVIENNTDILIATEIKINLSFSSYHFMIEGFSMLFSDRNRSGGRVIVYVQDDILSKQPTKHILSDDTEGVLIPVKFFFKHDICRQSYEKFFLVGYFNAEETEPRLCEF